MLPSLRSLVREQSLLTEVLCTTHAGMSAEAGVLVAEGVQVLAGSRAACLQHLPSELLAAIGERFLDSPVWHACKLGEASPKLGQVFMDDSLWENLFRHRFREASRSPRRVLPRGGRGAGGPRLSYAQLHALEARFRGGRYRTCSMLNNPHQGVAVLDLQVAPTGGASSVAFAALRDGAIMAYDLDPEGLSHGGGSRRQEAAEEAEGRSPRGRRGRQEPDGGDEDEPRHAAPIFELAPGFSSGPALCCLPITDPGADAGSPAPRLLAAGYALGRLGAWELPSGTPVMPRSWEQAHAGRVTALAKLGGGDLLSASSDGVLKLWALRDDRMGDLQQTFAGHAASVVSVAASPYNKNLFLSGSHDRSVRVWDVRVGGGETASVARWHQQDWVTCVEFHPTLEDRAFSSDKAVHLWDLRRVSADAAAAGHGGTMPHLASSHRHRKLVSRFRADPLRLASCSLDGSVKVSSLEAPAVRVASPLASPQSSPMLGPAVPTGLQGSLLHGMLADSGDVCTLRTSTDYILCIDFDATRLLAGGVDGRVDVYDFSHPGHFWHGPGVGGRLEDAVASARRRGRCSEPLGVPGLQEIEV